MSCELEAAGAAATAGLAAGAIEGKSGVRPAGAGKCPNCGGVLAGAYCAACGQPANISRTLGHVLGDFAHAFLHFDTKVWRTAPMLVGRPGTLTYRYIHGQRARFLSPLATFLFTIFLMFFVFSLAGGPNIGRAQVNGARAETLEDARKSLGEAESEAALKRKELAVAEAEAAAVRKAGGPGADGRVTGIVTGPRIEARMAEEGLARAKRRLAAAEARQQAVTEARDDLKADAPAVSAAVERAAEKDRPWQDELREQAEKGEVKPDTGWPALDARILNHLRNPDLALYKLQDAAYKFSFLLVPISLPFIAFLFLWKRGVTLFDHVVFSLYSLSFMSLLFMALALLARGGEWAAAPIAITASGAPPLHMFFHLKGTYALSWWSALWRTLALLVMTLVALLIFMATVLVLGVFS